MHDYTPPRKDKKDIIIPLLLFAVGAVCFICSSSTFNLGYPIFWQLGAIICVVAGIQIFNRYRMKTYTYVLGQGGVNMFADEFNRIAELENSDGLWLKIICTQGEKSTTVGGFPLTAVTGFVRGGRDGLADAKQIKHSFNFCNNMTPGEDAYTVGVVLNGEKISITLEPDSIIKTELDKNNINF